MISSAGLACLALACFIGAGKEGDCIDDTSCSLHGLDVTLLQASLNVKPVIVNSKSSEEKEDEATDLVHVAKARQNITAGSGLNFPAEVSEDTQLSTHNYSFIEARALEAETLDYGDRVVLAYTSESTFTSNCGWYGCSVASMDTEAKEMTFGDGGDHPESFHVRAKVRNEGDGEIGCVAYGDQIVLAYTSAAGDTSNCGWYGCRVAFMDLETKRMRFGHGGDDPTGFYVRAKIGNVNSGCVRYGDQIVLAYTSSTDDTSNCGWYGCRVAFMDAEIDVMRFGHGKDDPASFYVRSPDVEPLLAPDDDLIEEPVPCGLGVGGTCLSNGGDWASKLQSFSTGTSADKYFDSFFKVWSDLTPVQGYVFCFGDRKGKWIVDNEYGEDKNLYDSHQGLTYLRNLFIGSEDESEWGTVGLYYTFPCASQGADKYTELKAAIAVKTCAAGGLNFVFSISTDTFECFVDKIAGPLAEIVGALPEFTMGISLGKHMSLSGKVAYGDGDQITFGDLSMAAHLALSFTFRLSIGHLLDSADTIGELLAGDVQAQKAFAFDGDVTTPLGNLARGPVDEMIPDLIAGLRLAMQFGPTMAKTMLQAAGANGDVIALTDALNRCTILYRMTGYVTFALASVTQGILPDLSFQLAQVALIAKTSEALPYGVGAEILHPGVYFYLSIDLGAFVSSIIDAIFSQLGGFLDVIGVSGSISFTAKSGIGFFVTRTSLGFITAVNVGGDEQEVRCTFGLSNRKLKCKFQGNWAEMFIEAGRFIINKISNFAGDSAEEVAEFFTSDAGSAGKKFTTTVVAKGKNVAKRMKCKASKMLGGKCGKDGRYGGTSSKCGDNTEYVIKGKDRKCLEISSGCWQAKFQSHLCYPVWRECGNWQSSDYTMQMKAYWWFTKDRFLCNEFMHNMYYDNIDDPDMNPKCIAAEGSLIVFNSSTRHPAKLNIRKVSTLKFKFGMVGDDYCINANSGGQIDSNTWHATVRGGGGRRRRRCNGDNAKDFKIYQKLEPGDGTNYENENGDNQFNVDCVPFP